MPTPTSTAGGGHPSWFEDLTYTDDVSMQFMRALVYGPTGSGKTRFALTWPKPFVIDLDKGLLTGHHLHVPSKKIFPPKDRRDRQRVYQTIVDILVEAQGRSGPFAEGGPLVDRETIILDGYTALADALMKEILITDGLNFLDEKPQYDHWNALANRLESITQLTTDLPFNFVATCGNKQDKDETTGAWIGLPDIIGGYRNDIGYRFDEFYYFEPRRARASDAKSGDKDLIYEAHTAKYKIFDAKSRLDLPATIVNPTFDFLLEKKEEALSREAPS